MLPCDRLQMMALLVRVAETGRLAEASRTLCLSQPVASRMIRRLETSVGAELVRRSTRGLTLTKPGERMVETARVMLDLWSRATEGLSEAAAALSGPIRVAAPVSLGQDLLPRVFAAFIDRHPGITMDCELTDAPLDLPSHGLDLQINAGPIQRESMVVRDLWRVHRSIVARVDHRPVRHPADLAMLPAVRPARFVPPVIALTNPDGDSFDLRMRTVFSVDNLHAAVAMVRAGAGFAVLPCFATRQLILVGELHALCPAWQPPDVHLSITYLPNRLRSRRVDALITFLREHLTADEGLGIAFLGQQGIRETVTIPGPR